MSEEPHMLVNVVENILIATFNRPDKLNAMSPELLEILEAAVHQFRDTPELRVMLINSKGRYFSAGADLKQGGGGESRRMPTRGSQVREQHRKLPMRRIWDEMEGLEKPFVVAHHARCVGGSLEMSLSCDFRLAAASASYAFPEAKFGILPATNGVSRLVRIIGPHWARYMITRYIPTRPSRRTLWPSVGISRVKTVNWSARRKLPSNWPMICPPAKRLWLSVW
jgi:enoyl-CoA hydratase